MTGNTRKNLMLGAFIFAAFCFLIGFVSIVSAAYKYPYPYNEYEAGQWISETEQFFTYETICSGYYIADYSNKNKIKYTGYGDLEFKYTYEQEIPYFITATST